VVPAQDPNDRWSWRLIFGLRRASRGALIDSLAANSDVIDLSGEKGTVFQRAERSFLT